MHLFLLPGHEPLTVPAWPTADWRDVAEPSACSSCGAPAPAERFCLVGSRWLCTACAGAALAVA